MAKRKYTAEEIVTVLRKVEVSMATLRRPASVPGKRWSPSRPANRTRPEPSSSNHRLTRAITAPAPRRSSDLRR